MMQYLLKIDAALAKMEKWGVVLLFSAVALMMLFNILCRNILQVSFQNILEVAPQALFWSVLLGASLALRHQRHIRLDVAVRFFSPALQSAAGRITGIFGAGVMGTLFLASLSFVKNEIDMFGYGGWAVAILPVFFILAALRFFIQAMMPPAGEADESRPLELGQR
jgi:TRAP-type C4-dicarboxylate transport system permease small subunit